MTSVLSTPAKKECYTERPKGDWPNPSPDSFPSVCDDSVKVFCPVTFPHGCPFFCIWELFFSAFGVHFQRLPQHGHTEMLSVLAVFFSYYLSFVRAMPSCPSWLTRKGWPLNNLKLTSYFEVSSTRVESWDPCLILVHLLFSLLLGAGVCGLATELWVSSKELRHESRKDGIMGRRETTIGGGEKGVQEDGEKAGGETDKNKVCMKMAKWNPLLYSWT